MPSIQDVADQINAKLDAISTNTGNTATNSANALVIAQSIKDEIAETNSRLGVVQSTLQAGFSNLSQGIFLLTELQKVGIFLLDHHRRQNDTLICLGENTNDLLCGITRKLTTQIDLSEATRKLLDRIEGVAVRVHADEAGDYDRQAAIQAEMARCCPPDEPTLEPCPETCPRPKFKPAEPRGGEWKPLPGPKAGGGKAAG